MYIDVEIDLFLSVSLCLSLFFFASKILSNPLDNSCVAEQKAFFFNWSLKSLPLATDMEPGC